jgi:predicted amidophosphoribosyltransferase
MKMPDHIVTQYDVERRKPTPLMIDVIANETEVDRREMLYLGDRNHDAYCAVNGNILPLAAKYSNPDMEYGLSFPSPASVTNYLRLFGSQRRPYFSWWYQGKDGSGRSVNICTLLFNHGWKTDQNERLTRVLKRVLKHHQDVSIGNWSVRVMLFFFLITQCYLSGLVHQVDWITVYPGHEAGSSNPTLDKWSSLIQSTLNRQFKRDLLHRHTTASKSQYGNRAIHEQLSTLRVNPTYSEDIGGKSVLVIDDFTTSGMSMEAARQLLYQAGASEVYCVAVAKYRQRHSVTTVVKDWDAFSSTDFSEEDVQAVLARGNISPKPDNQFKDTIWAHFERG